MWWSLRFDAPQVHVELRKDWGLLQLLDQKPDQAVSLGSQPDLVFGPAVEEGPNLSAIRRALVEHRTATTTTPSTVSDPAVQAEQERIQREAALAWVQVNAR